MLIYNTTFHVDDDVAGDALAFFKKIFIPQALSSGKLSEPRLALIHHQNEEPGASYSLQFRVENVDILNDWLHVDGNVIHHKLVELFSDKIAGFNTILEEIEL